ncbi:MAG: hypothetical protein ING88_03905 [Cytophagales bacterium]|nr:hypothetical protein [Cytophagales bacterium]
MLFTSAPQAAQPTASNMEAGTNPNFQNYNNMVGFDLFDHTDAGTVFQYSQKLTGGNNAQVGLAKTYNVMAGDKVKIELFAKYFNPQSTSSNLTGFATALASAFGVSAASTGEALKAYNGLNNYGGLVAAGTAHNDNGFPKLFVNILLFDKNYVLIDAAWQQIDGGEQPVGNGTKLPHDFMSAELTAREPGFAYVYFSNESATLVEGYFDDVTMTYTPGNILQYNEYYPFGLQTANSWTRENTTGNNFLFNGGTELNSTTGVYDLHYRNYDPVLGRMTQVDPVAGKYASLTPYNYAFNSPANLNDPLGDEPPFFNREAWRGNMRGGAVYPRGGRNGMDDADWGNSGSLSAGSFGRSVYEDARDVRNGQMSLEAYAGKYGSNLTLSDMALTMAAMTGNSVLGSTIGSMTYGGVFSFQINGKDYGGNFVVINGSVQSLAFAYSLPTDIGGLVVRADINTLVNVGPGQSYQSALNSWANNARGADMAGMTLAGGGMVLSMTEDMFKGVGTNLRLLQYQAWDNGMASSFGNSISKVSKITTSLQFTGYGLGAFNAYSVTQQYLNSGKSGFNTWNLIVEQGSNVYSTLGGVYGAAWGVGWELGRAVTNIPGYQAWRNNTWLPFREKYLRY